MKKIPATGRPRIRYLVASMVKVAFGTESERCDRPGDILGGIDRALTGKFDRAYITACCV